MAEVRNRLKRYFEEIDKSRAQRNRQAEIYEEGFERGRRWLCTGATINQADCLALFREHLWAAGRWDSWFAEDPSIPFSIAARWHFNVIDPRGSTAGAIDPFVAVSDRQPLKPNRVQAARFWKLTGATAKQRANGVFIQGFSDGALQAWNDFKLRCRDCD